MQNNDISNTVPPRVIVTSDVVATVVKQEEKKHWYSRTREATKVEWDHEILAWLFQWSFRVNVVLELALVGEEYDRDDAKEYEEMLDRWGTNPFTWIEVYESAERLARTLPYRNDIYGVASGQPGMYGSYGLSPDQLP